MSITRRFACYGTALGSLAVLAACGTEIPEAPPQLRPVRYVTVASSSAGFASVYAGVARASVESRLSFRVAGTIDRLPTRVGDRVRRGQTLARLDSTDYDLEVERAQASLAQARASLRRGQADYARARALYENNNIAKSDLDAARAASESAQAQVDAAQKALEQSRQKLGYTLLQAPLDGAIAEVAVEVNESVSAGQAVVLLTSGSLPEVVSAVPEVLISQVAKGQPVQVAFDALPARTFPAEITEVGVAASSSSAFEVTAKLLESSPEIRSGMSAEVTFRFPDPAGRSIYLPPVAVGEDDAGRFVFVLEGGDGGEGQVRRRDVTVGELTQQGLGIRAGIEPGERVVTAGVRRLSDGMAVRVLAQLGADR